MDLETRASEVRTKLAAAHPLFPSRCCKFAAAALHAIGYEIVTGRVHVPNYYQSGEPMEMVHFWNFDTSSGRYVDITASQFTVHQPDGLCIPEILVWLPGEQPAYREQRRGLRPEEIF